MEYCGDSQKIKCPHCGHEKAKEAEDLPWTDDGQYDEKCYECNENFLIRSNVRISWTTHKDTDDD